MSAQLHPDHKNKVIEEQRIDFDVFRGLLIPYLQAIRVTLRQAGPNTSIGRCPIHQEKSGAAFAVYSDGHWWCFGKCNRGGDVIDLDRELNGGELIDAVKRIRAMNLGEPLPLDSCSDCDAIQTAITPDNPFGLQRQLSDKEQAFALNCAHRLKESAFWLSQISSWRGWKPQTLAMLAAQRSLGVDPTGRLFFIYLSGLKYRYNDLDTGEPIKKWVVGSKQTLWRINHLPSAKKVYLTEGEIDAVSVIDEGVEQKPGTFVIAVPCAGFNLAPLASLFIDKEIVLVPDPDEAGLKAGRKWVHILEPYAAHLSYLSFISKEVSPHGQE